MTPDPAKLPSVKPIIPSVAFARLLHSQDTMRPLAKVGLVVAGYVLAATVAAAAVTLFHLVTISGPNGGMNAFGDCLLFLAVFGVGAVLPTGAGLFFLRPWNAFWRGFSATALVFALTSLAAFIVVNIDDRSMLGGLVFLRILVAPLFSLNFLVSGFFAPNRASRMALFVAAGIEAAGFACWVGGCLLRNLGHA